MKKKAKDLKPGDVIVADNKKMVLLRIRGTTPASHGLLFGVLDGDGEDFSQLKIIFPLDEIEVEQSPALTPAQQHAEELLALVRRVSAAGINPPPGTLAYDSNILLAKIDPPKLPSAEELAEALQIVQAELAQRGSGIAIVNDLVKRARSAGLLGEKQ